MNNKNILIVVAHPDDETIGCGGTIQYHQRNKKKVFVMSFTDGISSRNEKKNINKISIRNNASKKAEKLLGFKWFKNYNYPDNALDTVKFLDLVKNIESAKKKINPSIVYTHYFNDLNIDHQLVSKACITAFRPEPKKNKAELRFFEIPSSTDFSFKKDFEPNLFISVKNFWKKKEKALKAYGSEIKKKPHSRSLHGIRNLSNLRGSQSGLDCAEAFQIYRKIVV